MQAAMHRLVGKKAFVTGGSRGIGAGIVCRLAREDAAVAFTYRGRRDAAERSRERLKNQVGRPLPFRRTAATQTL